jgi:hypothetical protein
MQKLTFNSLDLPPTVIAKPLPVGKSAKANGIFSSDVTASRQSKKRKRNVDKEDDTPKAFKRLMLFQQGKKLPRGLDNGEKPAKKAKGAKGAKAGDGKDQVVEPTVAKPEMPKILPGERLAEFNARVDQALPLGGLLTKTVKGGKDPLGLKVARTRKEKKMHKMYEEWREQDRKIKEKQQEALELAEEEEEEEGAVKWKIDSEIAEQKKGKKGKKGKKVLGEIDDGDDDPWAKLRKARQEGPVKLNDVAQAPPQLVKIREKFKVKGGARVDIGNVPKASGSLRRREELGEIRQSIVENYRRMMKENKAAKAE